MNRGGFSVASELTQFSVIGSWFPGVNRERRCAGGGPAGCRFLILSYLGRVEDCSDR